MEGIFEVDLKEYGKVFSPIVENILKLDVPLGTLHWCGFIGRFEGMVSLQKKL